MYYKSASYASADWVERNLMIFQRKWSGSGRQQGSLKETDAQESKKNDENNLYCTLFMDIEIFAIWQLSEPQNKDLCVFLIYSKKNLEADSQ